MIGGGFGGCTINLLRPEARENFATGVLHEYREETGIESELYDVKIVNGVEEIA
jgi:galactokinase